MADKISVKIEKFPGSEVKISITIPANEFETYIAKAAQDLSKNMKVDGFRSGKIPQDVVERNVGSEALLYEGAERAVKKSYVDAILDNKIEAIGQPKVEMKKIARGNDLEFEATVGVMPVVELKDWKDEVQKINKEYEKKQAEMKVEEKEIQRELDYLAKQRAKIVTVNRSAQKGDQVMIDFEVWKDNVPIEGGTAKNHQLVLGEGRFIPGFEDRLVDAKAGDTREFELEFPKDYHEKNLAGQKALFKVTVNLVQERQVPGINDEFASGIGKFKNLDELKKNISDGIAHENKHKVEDEHKRKLLDHLVSQTVADLPAVLIELEIARMMDEMENEVSSLGLDKQAYFDHLKTSEEKMKEQWKQKEAPDRVKAALALRELAKQQKLSPDAKEIEERMNKYIQYYKTAGDAEKNLDLEKLYDMVKGNLANEKVIKFLMEQ